MWIEGNILVRTVIRHGHRSSVFSLVIIENVASSFLCIVLVCCYLGWRWRSVGLGGFSSSRHVNCKCVGLESRLVIASLC